nr:movement protein [Actinidia yellowing virus 3]
MSFSRTRSSSGSRLVASPSRSVFSAAGRSVNSAIRFDPHHAGRLTGGSQAGKTSLPGIILPELRAPRNPEPPRGDSYLQRRRIDLPVVYQQDLIGADGATNGECYLLDGGRTDLLEVAAKALKDDQLLEFNKFKEFKKFKGSISEFGLVQASKLRNLIRPDRKAVHLNRLLIAVVPAVNQGTPGRVSVRLTDARMEGQFGTVFSCVNPVTSGYVYCINLGYSVPASELDFRLRIEFLDVPIKDGMSPVWVKTAFHLSDASDPVFLQGTMSLGANMRADSHTEMLGHAALLLQEANGHRKSFSGRGDEIDDRRLEEARSEESLDVGPQDSVSQVSDLPETADAGGVSFSNPVMRY